MMPLMVTVRSAALSAKVFKVVESRIEDALPHTRHMMEAWDNCKCCDIDHVPFGWPLRTINIENKIGQN